MSDLVLKAQKAEQTLSEWKKSFFDFNQDRTLFMLEKFVIGQHPTPARRYLQLMTELWLCYNHIRRLLLDYREAQLDLSEFDLAHLGERGQIQKQRCAIKIDQIEYELDAKMKEFAKMMALKEKMSSCTLDELENEDPEFYRQRLQNQANEDILSKSSSIGLGNLRAMIQAGMLEIKTEENGTKLTLKSTTDLLAAPKEP